MIDRPILDLLNIDTETPLQITTDGHKLIVVPMSSPDRQAQFEAIQRTIHARYAETFKRLAD